MGGRGGGGEKIEHMDRGGGKIEQMDVCGEGEGGGGGRQSRWLGRGGEDTAYGCGDAVEALEGVGCVTWRMPVAVPVRGMSATWSELPSSLCC